MNLLKVICISIFLVMSQSSFGQEVSSLFDSSLVIKTELGLKVDSVIMNENRLKFSGTVLIVKEGEILLKKQYSQKEKGNCPINPNYSYWIASLSKQFTASAILLLQEKGKLNTVDSINKYLLNVPSDKKNITIHHLLTHTSGLPDMYAADGIENIDRAQAAILKNKLTTKIGQKYSYSNDGYQLLAIIIEKVSGIKYDEFLNQEFFIPLNMNHSGNSGDKQKLRTLNVAQKGIGASKKIYGNPQDWPENYGYKGSTGVLSNPDDLYKWHLSIQNNIILSKESTNMLFKEHIVKDPENEIYYGYGWNIFESKNGKVIVHSGGEDFISHTSTFRYYPEKNLLLIITANSGYKENQNITQELSNKIVNLIF